mmetsp:Transcript_1354/g.3232  ORF Transcript_1354/g.3232 Transcript_1354/m.3232 type:complete len:214 (+) Transcript_1354:1671-2312(+)
MTLKTMKLTLSWQEGTLTSRKSRQWTFALQLKLQLQRSKQGWRKNAGRQRSRLSRLSRSVLRLNPLRRRRKPQLQLRRLLLSKLLLRKPLLRKPLQSKLPRSKLLLLSKLPQMRLLALRTHHQLLQEQQKWQRRNLLSFLHPLHAHLPLDPGSMSVTKWGPRGLAAGHQAKQPPCMMWACRRRPSNQAHRKSGRRSAACRICCVCVNASLQSV